MKVAPVHAEAPSTRSLPGPAGSGPAIVASAAMIAQQVAGKATRDALFLSNFSVKTLPAMMGVSAVGSLVVALWLSRMMLRHTPRRVVPVGFGASAVVLLVAWALSFSAPRAAAIVLYLYTSLFGAAVISTFWSLINETFDPHTSRSATTAIASGGTLGGLLGALATWRMSAVFSVPTMLPLLAGASLVSLWGSLRLPAVVGSQVSKDNAWENIADVTWAPVHEVRKAPYLRNLAAIVALGAVTSGLLDYVFSAEATRAFSKGPALLAFFSFFWLVVGVLSFVLQLLLGKVALEKLGVAVTVALLPAVVLLGGAVGLAVPGLWSVAILRGSEATQRNSLFRAAYEMLYTPLSEEKKRSTKTLIDVGFDRIGTVAAAGIAMLALAVASARAEVVLLVLAMACALASLGRSRALHKGYVSELEQSLRENTATTGLAAGHAKPEPEPPVALRDEIAERVQRPSGRSGGAPSAAGAGLAMENLDAAFRAVTELQSRDPERIRRVLSAEVPLTPPVAAFAILLLADKEFHVDAIRALRRCLPNVTGQLVDGLCDEGTELGARCRIPRVLSECPTQDAADGLVRGMNAERFSVRYACALALLKITGRDAHVTIAPVKVVAMVRREVTLGKDVWEGEPTVERDEEEGEPPALIARLQGDRFDRTLEHVFTLLALNLDRQSLRLAFKALHEKDERQRGTALEYLETVLPDEVRDVVWPLLGEERPMRPARPAVEILADLRRVPDTIAVAVEPLAPPAA
jgi:AAA family ATP:ADP antiporter